LVRSFEFELSGLFLKIVKYNRCNKTHKTAIKSKKSFLYAHKIRCSNTLQHNTENRASKFQKYTEYD